MSSDNLQTLLDATAGDLVTADYDSAQDVIALCGRVEKLRMQQPQQDTGGYRGTQPRPGFDQCYRH